MKRQIDADFAVEHDDNGRMERIYYRGHPFAWRHGDELIWRGNFKVSGNTIFDLKVSAVPMEISRG